MIALRYIAGVEKKRVEMGVTYSFLSVVGATGDHFSSPFCRERAAKNSSWVDSGVRFNSATVSFVPMCHIKLTTQGSSRLTSHASPMAGSVVAHCLG